LQILAISSWVMHPANENLLLGGKQSIEKKYWIITRNRNRIIKCDSTVPAVEENSA